MLLPCNSEKAFARRSATVALCEWGFEKVKLVVKGELFVLSDISQCKNANTDFVENGPLARLAVWTARVVNKTGHVSRVSWIDYLVVLDAHEVSAGRVPVTLEPLLADLGVNVEHLTYVLHHKGVFRDKLSGRQPPSFELRADGVDISVLELLEMAVSAEFL